MRLKNFRMGLPAITCLTLLCAYNGENKSPYARMLQQLRQANMADRISYDYDVFLVNQQTGRHEDSIAGHLWRAGREYLDSSSQMLTAVCGDYFCRLNYERRTATVCNVPLVAARLHMNLNDEPQSLIGIPDSLLTNYARLSVDTTAPDVFRIQVLFNQQQFADLWIELSRADYTVRSMVIEADDPETLRDPVKYRKVYHLYNIRHEASQAVFDLSHVFSLNGDKVILSKKYARYSLKTFTH